MNPKIQELAERAGDETSKELSWFQDQRAWHILFTKKFSNLILDHCCLIAMSQHQSSDFDSYDELDPYDRGGDDVASHISGRIFSLKS